MTEASLVEFEAVLEATKILPKEYITSAGALGRILAEDVKARASLPEYDIATIDGYAVKHTDIVELPITLFVEGESSSAKPYGGTLERGNAVKIYAGGKIPEGADCVLPMSDVTPSDDSVTINQAQLMQGAHIYPQGIDFANNEEAISTGTTMSTRLIGLASSMQVLWLPVVRKPRVGVLAVGSELAMPGEATTRNPTTASSLHSFAADIISAGGEPVILGIAHDSIHNIKAKVAEAAGCDLLLTTGGTSAAAGNLMKRVLDEVCDKTQTFQVDINRNDYMLYAKHQEMPVCSLPGNPISSKIYFGLFVRQIIERLVGKPKAVKRYAILARNVDEHDTSVAYLHASLNVDSSGTYNVTPVSAQEGFLLSELAKADCLVAMNKDSSLKKGDLVEIIPFS